MDPLVERVARNIRQRGLLKPRERILVAVSGGADSMALLAVLHELSPRFGWKLMIAHFNHRLRGRASDADERLVQKRATQLGLRCVTGAGDVRREARRRGLSLEMVARELRHRFLAVTARRRRIRIIVLAHHADDQAELFLLRLLRGTSSEGLGGMRWQAPSAFGKGILLVRPLLDIPKADLLAFTNRARLAFREDASNWSLDHLRNRVRHELLPRLERDFQPGIRSVLARVSEILADDGEFIGREAARWRPARHRLAFDRWPVAIQRRVLVEELIAVGVAPDFDLVERLRTTAGKQISAANGRLVSRDSAGKVQIESQRKSGFLKDRLAVSLSRREGSFAFADVEFEWSKSRIGQKPEPGWVSGVSAFGAEFFDADKVGRRVLLRHWQPGDRFQPIGMARPVKLQDLFTNAKVAAAERRRRVLAESESGVIFWVEGLRIGERFKLDSSTQQRLKWSWQRT